jgi:hypothetical protein
MEDKGEGFMVRLASLGAFIDVVILVGVPRLGNEAVVRSFAGVFFVALLAPDVDKAKSFAGDECQIHREL